MASYQIRTRKGIRYQYRVEWDPVQKKNVWTYMGSFGRIRGPDPASELLAAIFSDQELAGLNRILGRVEGSDRDIAKSILRKIEE